MWKPAKTRIITDPRACYVMHASGIKALGPVVEDFSLLEKKVEEIASAYAELQNQFVLLAARVTKLERDTAPAPHLAGLEKRAGK